jgi:hypothetical protein
MATDRLAQAGGASRSESLKKYGTAKFAKRFRFISGAKAYVTSPYQNSPFGDEYAPDEKSTLRAAIARFAIPAED